jgi:hypothetical protein
MTQSQSNARPRRVRGSVVGRRGRARVNAGIARERKRTPADKCVCSFGATRVGPMIERVRLHVTTDRFLAGRRGDKVWEAACDYAVLALARLESRLRPTVLAEWICATAGAGRRAKGGSAPGGSGGSARSPAGGRR